MELPAKPRFANKLIRNLMTATRMCITKEGPGFFELPLAVWLILCSVTVFWQAGSPPGGPVDELPVKVDGVPEISIAS